MDPFTLIFLGLTAVKAFSSISQSKEEAKAVTREGELATKEKAKEIRHRAARQTVSFLNSGLTLEGTPSDILGETYKVGLEDIKNIRQGYNTQSKNIIAKGRMDAISGIVSSFGQASMGGMFSSTGSAVGAGISSYQAGTGFGTGYDVYKSVNNPMNAGIF
ncbi:hypothetical protein KAR91_59820 [Candidatus Pacearchaeota archaeon]|nr:hypothetical protein [Candidatus Pacearchaeota archaeon]